MSDKEGSGGIRLIAVDMDGTALGLDSRMSSVTYLALKEQMEAGIMVIPASGRIFGGIPKELIDLKVPYVISANGASVVDVQAEKCIYESNISHEAGVALLKKLMAENGHAYIQYREQYFGDGRRAEEAAIIHPYMEQAGCVREQELEDLIGFLDTNEGTIQKIGFMAFDAAAETKVMDMGRGQQEFDVVSTGPLMIEFNKKGTSKGSALSWLCGRLGIQAESVLAIGDNGNDISMLTFAGTGVAMGNATEEVKKAADFVTLSNAEDGVAWALRRRDIAMRKDVPFKDVNVKELQKTLIADGCDLGIQ